MEDGTMDERSSGLRSTLLKLILALLPGFILVWLLQRKKVDPAPKPPDLQVLQLENERLKQQVKDLKFSPSLVATESKIDSSPKNSKPLALKLFFAVAGAAMLLFPPIMVVLERWFNDPSIHDSMRNAWCRTDWLCDLYLPSYFLLAIPFFLGVILIFFAFAPAYPQIFSNSQTNDPSAPMPLKPGKRQIIVSDLLRVLALLGAGVLLYFGLTKERLPGAELLVVIALYILGQYLGFYPINNWRSVWRRMPVWLLPVILTVIALVLFLQSAYSQPDTLWLCAALLFLALIYLWKYRSQFSPVVWVMMLAMVLYSWQMDSWRFSVIGDDYSFFGYARDILNQQPLADNLKNLFLGQAVYNAHPYFSSLIQAFFMKILGITSFGWRFSSIFLAALSLVFFYQFFKRFLNTRIALVTVILLAASQYLMGFSKIGYNNLQALLVMSLVLWRAGVAVQTRRPIDYSW
ncbi:MAG: glycosyltransferase family 39 protein, partial [Anaerolineaceae bacterium]|nr:glycosyltransferase family 39 protein [Anaerolineaceae bacterium]